jgi:hypothetical protein
MVQHAITQQQHTIMRMVRASPGTVRPQRSHHQKLLETGRSECQTRRTPNWHGNSNGQGAQGNPRGTKPHTDEEGQDKGFCQRRMETAEDPFSHTYGGSSEFNVAAFSTTFDRRAFGRRIIANINTNINEPTISADRSWAYLNFGSTHKHRFLYNTGASVTLITPQTFEHAGQNGKVGKKWTGHGISIKNASGGEMEITGVYVSGNIVIPAFS